MTIARLRDFVAAMIRLVEHDGNAETTVPGPAPRSAGRPGREG
jgi:hypothetical protein